MAISHCIIINLRNLKLTNLLDKSTLLEKCTLKDPFSDKHQELARKSKDSHIHEKVVRKMQKSELRVGTRKFAQK